MTQLILQHRQQIRNNTNPLLQQSHPLIHLQVTPHSLVDGIKLRLCPHELRSIEDRTLQMDVDSKYEELADLHVDLSPSEVYATGSRDGAGY